MSHLPHHPDLGAVSLLEMFRVEAEMQCAILTKGLLDLERSQKPAELLEALMRAAHSIKGAARIVNLGKAVQVAHALEDCLVAAQNGALKLGQAEVDNLLQTVDLLSQFGKYREDRIADWETDQAREIEKILRLLEGTQPKGGRSPQAGGVSPFHPNPGNELTPAPLPETSLPVRQERGPEHPERVVRLNAENLNRLLGLAGESLVESRWLRPFTESLERLNRLHGDLTQNLTLLRNVLEREKTSEASREQLLELSVRMAETRTFLREKMQELDLYDRRSAQLSNRLYLEVLRTRMRPFGEGVRRFPRMVRDLARSLKKDVKLEVLGESTQVDRDILERLETPISHLLRNAVDHGCETLEQRQLVGKPPENTIRLEARHHSGVLLVTVTDDGCGISVENIRHAVLQKKLVTSSVAEKLSESELLEFLFLPGFSLRDQVTEISGRGVGLDVVQNMAKSLRGSIRLNNQPGRGLRIQLQLPLTLSVLRALLVDIAGEPYALPLAQVVRAVRLESAELHSLEGRVYCRIGEQQIGLMTGREVLECPAPKIQPKELAVVVIGDRNARYGLIVDRFLGERELMVQPLDERLGKVRDVSAAALMEDGSPVLIMDTEDLVRSIEKMLVEGTGGKLGANGFGNAMLAKPKKILIADDSLTVRELERKLLGSRGYLTDAAVDGMDAWNAVRSGNYDLVITDVDMPRIDGFELVTLMKKDPQLKHVPVLIVSYKDRPEDRIRGLDAGADYYLAKGTFTDEALVQAVVDLIGDAGT